MYYIREDSTTYDIVLCIGTRLHGRLSGSCELVTFELIH